uniref:Transposase n=1 Tax=Ditylenchus dipsaci TaxID=166011 RepID=A0A915DRF2_9BILA
MSFTPQQRAFCVITLWWSERHTPTHNPTKGEWKGSLLGVDQIQGVPADQQPSIRDVARLEDTPSNSTIHRIAKDEFHPYKMQLRQLLRPIDQQKRVVHANNQLQLLEQDERFFDKIMFSDESHFHIHGQVNRQNFRYWCETNPHWYREAPLHSPRITVWAALGRMSVVGPIFMEGNVTAASYLRLLQEKFLPWS